MSDTVFTINPAIMQPFLLLTSYTPRISCAPHTVQRHTCIPVLWRCVETPFIHPSSLLLWLQVTEINTWINKNTKVHKQVSDEKLCIMWQESEELRCGNVTVNVSLSEGSQCIRQHLSSAPQLQHCGVIRNLYLFYFSTPITFISPPRRRSEPGRLHCFHFHVSSEVLTT